MSIQNANPIRTLNSELVCAAVAKAACGEGFEIDDLSIVLADHSIVRDLNRRWLGHDFETDVVSFSLSDTAVDNRRIDGEIYVDLDTAHERAPTFGVSYELEALRYVIHGLLHLMGYDDASDEQRAAMRALEDRYLKGVQD